MKHLIDKWAKELQKIQEDNQDIDANHTSTKEYAKNLIQTFLDDLKKEDAQKYVLVTTTFNPQRYYCGTDTKVSWTEKKSLARKFHSKAEVEDVQGLWLEHDRKHHKVLPVNF